jgi:hypothetical protein
MKGIKRGNTKKKNKFQFLIDHFSPLLLFFGTPGAIVFIASYGV